MNGMTGRLSEDFVRYLKVLLLMPLSDGNEENTMNFAIGLSGLNTAVTRLDRAASDIARASVQTAPTANAATVNTPQPTTPAPAGEVSAGGQTGEPAAVPTDLVTAVVEQISASSAFMANLKTIETSDQNLEALMKLR